MLNNQLVAHNHSLTDIHWMAGAIAKSNLFGIKTMEEAASLMLIAQAEGMHPATAARDYHVIQGKPTLKADAILSRFQTSGGKVVWDKYTAEEVSGTFSHPAGGSVTINWSMKMANGAGLTGKDTWKKYPRQMLRARVISEGVRTVYPAVCVGVYTPEEIESIQAPPPKPPVVTDFKVLDAPPKDDEKSKTTTNFNFLKEVGKLKKIVGEDYYYGLLKSFGYKHANEILPREHQEAFYHDLNKIICPKCSTRKEEGKDCANGCVLELKNGVVS